MMKTAGAWYGLTGLSLKEAVGRFVSRRTQKADGSKNTRGRYVTYADLRKIIWALAEEASLAMEDYTRESDGHILRMSFWREEAYSGSQLDIFWAYDEDESPLNFSFKLNFGGEDTDLGVVFSLFRHWVSIDAQWLPQAYWDAWHKWSEETAKHTNVPAYVLNPWSGRTILGITHHAGMLTLQIWSNDGGWRSDAPFWPWLGYGWSTSWVIPTEYSDVASDKADPSNAYIARVHLPEGDYQVVYTVKRKALFLRLRDLRVQIRPQFWTVEVYYDKGIAVPDKHGDNNPVIQASYPCDFDPRHPSAVGRMIALDVLKTRVRRGGSVMWEPPGGWEAYWEEREAQKSPSDMMHDVGEKVRHLLGLIEGLRSDNPEAPVE